MEACIISTAQQASPNVIHIREPVRAQLMRSSVVVTRKPLSASLFDTSVNPRPGTTKSVLGCERVVTPSSPAAGCSVPLECSLAPLVGEPDGQNGQERHHGPEAIGTHLPEGHRPGKQERHLQVEYNEQDRHQVEAHVEFHACVVEGVESALEGRDTLRA